MYRPGLLAILLSPVVMIPMLSLGQSSGLGLKIGPLLSTTRTGAISTNMIPGATAGFYFALKAGPRFELQPELLVTSLGAGYTLPDGERSTVRILYAQVPLSAKVFLGNVFNAQFGMQMGRLLLAQQNSPNGSEDVTASYNTWDYGYIVGAGVDLVSGMDIGLRYYSGLRAILSEDLKLFPHNRAVMLTVGYRLARVAPIKFKRRRN